MAGYKTFVAGEEALAADVNSYLMSQTVSRFANASARAAAITAPVLNQLSMLDSRPGGLDVWNGTAWEAASAGSELIYAQVTAPLAVVNTSSATSHVFVDGGPRTYDGQPVVLEGYCPYAVCAANGAVTLGLWDGSTHLGILGSVGTLGTAIGAALDVTYRFTPSAGSHAYKLGAWATTGPGTLNCGTGTGGGYMPGFLRITRA